MSKKPKSTANSIPADPVLESARRAAARAKYEAVVSLGDQILSMHAAAEVANRRDSVEEALRLLASPAARRTMRLMLAANTNKYLMAIVADRLTDILRIRRVKGAASLHRRGTGGTAKPPAAPRTKGRPRAR